MFENGLITELASMYSVFSRVPHTLNHIIDKMQPYIETKGEMLVMNQEYLKDPLKFTASLLEFKSEVDRIVDVCFDKNMEFQKARDNSFQKFMNK